MASILQLLLLASLAVCLVESKDMLRKSIIFDKKTPDVFYCPQKKPKGVDKMLVKAKPLKKLCEFEGKPLPPDYKSDCYNDVDETEYACKEKHRIMKRMKKLEHEIEKKETERAYRSRRISPTSNEREMRLNPPGSELLKEMKVRYIKHRSKPKIVSHNN